MRFRCPHCDEWGNVRTSERQSATVTYMYVQCTNMECGHNWRVDAAASLTLSPSAMPRHDVLIPVSPYVRRDAVARNLEMAQTGEHHSSRPMQLDVFDDAPQLAPSG